MPRGLAPYLAVRFLAFVNNYAILPLIATYVLELGGSVVEAGLAIGVFSIVSSATRPLAGRLTDRRGRRFTVLLGAVLAGLATLGYLAAATPLALLAIRCVHGLSFSALSTASQTAAVDLAPRERMVTTMSYVNLSRDLGLAIGPILGTALFGLASWNGLFAGASLAAFSVALVALRSQETRPSDSLSTKERAAGGFFEPSAVRPAIVGMTGSLVYGAVLSFVPIYVAERQLGPPSLFFTIFAVSVTVARPFAGRVGDVRGTGAAVVSGFVCISIAMFGVRFAGDILAMCASAVLYALGVALFQPALVAVVARKAPRMRRGLAVGTFIGTLELAMSAGAIAGGPLVSATGFGGLFLVLGVVPLLGIAAYHALLGKADRMSAGSPPDGPRAPGD